MPNTSVYFMGTFKKDRKILIMKFKSACDCVLEKFHIILLNQKVSKIFLLIFISFTKFY